MLDYSYAVGISPSMWIAVIIGGAAFLGTFYYFFVRGISTSQSLVMNYISAMVVGFLFGYLTGFAAFCGSYSILNPLLQLGKLLGSDGSFSSFIIDESSTGALGLRIASVTLGYAVVMALTRFLFQWPKQERSSDMDKLQPVITDALISLTNVSQYALYVMVLANLWFLTINGVATWQVLILNWALFFILDDWALINDYRYATKGRITVWANRRVWGCNLLLSTLVAWVVVREFWGDDSYESLFTLGLASGYGSKLSLALLFWALLTRFFFDPSVAGDTTREALSGSVAGLGSRSDPLREERDRLLKERENVQEEAQRLREENRRLQEELKAERDKGFFHRVFGG